MQSETMPSELNLSAPPTIPQARSYITKQSSEYTEYDVNKGTKIRVDIPRLQRSYLMKESYIRFRLNIDISNTVSGSLLAFDRMGAHGLFDRIEVYDYLGGTLLEQTNNISALSCLLYDVDENITSSNGKSGTSQGMMGAMTQVWPAQMGRAFLEVEPSMSGRILYANDSANAAGSQFVTVEYCLPVMSFLGTLSNKYVPLHNGFSVYFYLNSRENAFISRLGDLETEGGSPTVQGTIVSVTVDECWISNFEYVCQIMELGDQAESIVMATDPLIIHSKQYRNFTDTILGSGQQSSARVDLNLNVVSLRNLYFSMRPTVYQNNILYPSYGHRIRNFLENWNFQYGSSYLPEIAGISCRSSTLPVSRKGGVYAFGNQLYKSMGITQAAEELSKTSDITSMTNIDEPSFFIDTNWVPSSLFGSYIGNRTINSWFLTGAQAISSGISADKVCVPFIWAKTATNATLEAAYIGKFAGGLNTRLSKKSTVSGIDTNGLQLSINMKFDYDNVSLMTDAILDVWAEHDSFVQIIPGVATTVTF